MVDNTLCTKYKQLSASESVKNTTMWIGSHEVEQHDTYVMSDDNKSFVKTQLVYPTSMLQTFMEQVANALDARNDDPSNVNTFRFTFDAGMVSIYNNGKSIPVAKVLDLEHKEVWLPEMLCNKFLTSSNHDKTIEKKRITLGAHGIGLKAMTSMSKLMRVECVDIDRNKYYFQEIKNCNTEVCEPIIKLPSSAPKEIRQGGTRFTYMLDYDHYKNLPSNIFETLEKLIVARVHQIAGYTCSRCFYNGKEVKVSGPQKLAEMYFGKGIAFMQLEGLEFPLSVAVAPSNDGIAERLSIINGGFISDGVHFRVIEDKIIDAVRARTETYLKDKIKNWRRNIVVDNLSILIVGTIPDIKFAEQIKTNLQMDKKYFSKLVLPGKSDKKIWDILRIQLEKQHYTNATEKKHDTRRKLQNRDKYEPARKLRLPQSDLLVFEGDSAKSSAKCAMADSKIAFSAEYHGIFLLGGCPINVLNHMTQKRIGERVYESIGEKINNNVIWNDFMVVMNLRYGVDYENDKEFKQLNYQRLTMVVDKDDHGMGKIAPIFISNIVKFWPSLLKRTGFLAYMDTPIIRAFPDNKKTRVVEFMTKKDFDDWKHSNFGTDDVSGWRIKYYKGMGSHTNTECSHMFGRYVERRIIFTAENIAETLELLYDYFGKDSAPRKQLLVLPPADTVVVESSTTLSNHLNSYTKVEQQYNLLCKLNSWADGFIFAHRKIAMAFRTYVDGKNSEIKVYQFGGLVAQWMGYHHGDASLYGSIVWLAQDFVGARNIPIGLPLGQFGTRLAADDDASPRYIDTKANPIIRLLFPKEDMPLLEMREEDGKTLVPMHLMPVMPLAIMETSHLPGTGWAINRTARNPHDILDNIKRMLLGQLPQPMRPWLPNWRGRIVVIDGHEWCVGSCSYDRSRNTVVIHELPFGIKNNNYIYGSKMARKKADDDSDRPGLFSRDLIDHDTIVDDSSQLEIKISFKLVDGAIDTINEKYGNEYFTPLEDYLMLKGSMRHNLNYVNDDGSVHEFATYEGVLAKWFMERYKLYRKRFEYQKEMSKWKLFYLTEKLRFIRLNDNLNLDKKKRTEQETILAKNSFKKLNTKRIDSPGCRHPSEIEAAVFGSGATYKYIQLTFDDMCEEAIQELTKKIDEIKQQYKKFDDPNILSTTWINECTQVIEIIDDAHKNGWVKNDDLFE